MPNELPAKRGSGARTKYTPERREAILNLLRDGMPVTRVATAVKISFQTLCDWRRKYGEFDELCELAITEGIKAHLENIRDAAFGGDWRASAFLLQNLHPEHFSQRHKVEHQHQHVGVTFQIPIEILDSLAEARKTKSIELDEQPTINTDIQTE